MNLKARAKGYFESHPTADTLHMTTDGMAFFQPHAADTHSRNLPDRAIRVFNRADLDSNPDYEGEDAQPFNTNSIIDLSRLTPSEKISLAHCLVKDGLQGMVDTETLRQLGTAVDPRTVNINVGQMIGHLNLDDKQVSEFVSEQLADVLKAATDISGDQGGEGDTPGDQGAGTGEQSQDENAAETLKVEDTGKKAPAKKATTNK